MIRTALILLILLLTSGAAVAQIVLQIERSSSLKTKKIAIGTGVTYRMEGDKTWYSGTIERLLPEDSLIVFNNRYLKVGQISAFRYERPWTRVAGRQLFWFGLAWSGFALIGTATDGIESTNYRWSDAAVTGSAVAVSTLLPKLFYYRKLPFGKNKRLRIVDLNPAETP